MRLSTGSQCSWCSTGEMLSYFLDPDTKAVEERYLTVLLDLLSKLDVSIQFVQVFVEFVDFVFVYSSDRIIHVA